MSAATILTLANSKGIDLVAPVAADIDFTVIAEHLAKVKRYNGATPGTEYSVAQHCVIAADQAFDDTHDRELAAYVLLHDGHEAFLGDDTTPKKRALAEIAARNFGVLAEEIMDAFDMMVDAFDRAIHEAAGLAWPPPDGIKPLIKSYDLTMFVTEWRDLMKGRPHPNWEPYRGIDPLAHNIGPWPWTAAQASFLTACRHYLPVLRTKGAA